MTETGGSPTQTVKVVVPTTLYELRFDNDEYWIPLGLFNSRAAAVFAWDLIKAKLNPEYRDSEAIVERDLYRALPDTDAIDAIVGEIGDHCEDATAFTELDDDGDTESPDEEPSPPPISIGQTSLPI